MAPDDLAAYRDELRTALDRYDRVSAARRDISRQEVIVEDASGRQQPDADASVIDYGLELDF